MADFLTVEWIDVTFKHNKSTLNCAVELQRTKYLSRKAYSMQAVLKHFKSTTI